MLIAKFTLEITKNALEIHKNAIEIVKFTLENAENVLEIANFKVEIAEFALENGKNALEIAEFTLEIDEFRSENKVFKVENRILGASKTPCLTKPNEKESSMIAILEKLKAGSTEIGPIYKNCVALWKDVLTGADTLNDQALADKLKLLQMKIERACNDNSVLGKAIIACSGFSYLYDDKKGFEDNLRLADKLKRAFELSGVSIEVKSMAAEAAKLFGLD